MTKEGLNKLNDFSECAKSYGLSVFHLTDIEDSKAFNNMKDTYDDLKKYIEQLEKNCKGFCKNCSYRDKDRACLCPKINESSSFSIPESDDELRYCYEESGGFDAGDNFGCVHFKQK